MAGRFGPLRLRSNHITKTPLGKARFPGICRARGGKIWYNNHRVASVPGTAGQLHKRGLLSAFWPPPCAPDACGRGAANAAVARSAGGCPPRLGRAGPCQTVRALLAGRPAFYQGGRQRFSGPGQPSGEAVCRLPRVGGRRSFPANSAGGKDPPPGGGPSGEWFEGGGFSLSSNGPLLGRLRSLFSPLCTPAGEKRFLGYGFPARGESCGNM